MDDHAYGLNPNGENGVEELKKFFTKRNISDTVLKMFTEPKDEANNPMAI